MKKEIAGVTLTIRLDSRTKEQVTKKANSEGKNASIVIKELIHNYLNETTIATPDIHQIKKELDNLKKRVAVLEKGKIKR